MLLSCKKASELIEKKSNFSLSFVESLRLKLHIVVCGACESYRKKSSLIDAYLSQKLQVNSRHEEKLSQSSKNKIIDTIFSK